MLFVDLASKLGKLDELASDIVAARKKLPDWTAGDALLAMVLCRAGRYREAEKLVQEFPETIKRDPVAASGTYLFYAYSAIAQGLEQNAASRELATKVYEHRAQCTLFVPPIPVPAQRDAARATG